MNLNLIVKTAVATALLSAASASAFATSVTPPASGPTPDPGFGAGGLVVEVWDTSAGTSLSEWLGGDLSTFGAPTAQASGLVSDYGILGGASTFNSLFSAADVAAGKVQFNVSAVNNNAPSAPIVDSTISTLGTIRGSGAVTFAQNVTTGIEAVLNGLTACNNVNPCTATSATAPGSAVKYLGQTILGGAKASGIAGGTALDFYQVTGTGKNTDILSAVQFGNANGAATWALSSTGDLVYTTSASPVPLPAAIWLLGSGLLGLAGIGRRKALAA